MPTICIYEVFKQLLVQREEEDALQVIGLMSLGHVVDLTQEIDVDAALISTQHIIAMADSIILAAAHAHRATLWTEDADFKGMDGVQYIAKD